MRTLLSLALLLLSFQSVEAQEHEAQPSALDLFLKEMGGEIPFPPEKIINKLTKLKISVQATIFPNGRSLERPFTSIKQPRSLIAFDLAGKNGEDKASQTVFLAYTPGNEGLQIISQNREKNGFDFTLVSNYAQGKKSHREPAQTGLCTSCHQNGGPIFPRFPWSETENNLAVRMKLTQEKALDPFAELLLKDNRVTLNAGAYEAIVKNVTKADGALSPSNECQRICGTNRDCQEALMKASIFGALSDGVPTGNGSPILNESDRRAVEASLKKRKLNPNLLLGSEDYYILKDRDPAGNEKNMLPGPGNDPLASRKDLGAEETGISVLNFKDFIGLGMNCVRFTPAQAKILKDLDRKKIPDAFKTPFIESAFNPFPPIPEEFILGLLRAEKAASSQGQAQDPNCSSSVSPMDAQIEKLKQATGRAAEELSRNRISLEHKNTSELYLAYCSSCHFGANAPAPPLPLDDMNALKKFRGSAGRTLQSVLSPPNYLMPPEGALMPSEKDRAEMIEAMGEAKPQ